MQPIPSVSILQGKAKQIREGAPRTMGDGKLDTKPREQLGVVVAGFNGCDYCDSAHTFVTGESSIAEDELRANSAGHFLLAKETISNWFVNDKSNYAYTN